MDWLIFAIVASAFCTALTILPLIIFHIIDGFE